MVLAAALFFAHLTTPEMIHLVVDGVDREAIVYAPSRRTSTKPPVLISFHGHGGSPQRMNDRAHFETLWPEAVVVYPQGLPTVIQDPSNKAPGWALEVKETNRDIKLFDALRKTVLDRYDADPNKFFAFGFSNGAMFMYTLWSLRGHQLAGLGSSEGCMIEEMKLSPARPFFMTISSDDTNVPVEYQNQALAQVKTTDGAKGDGTAYGEKGRLFKGEQPVVLWSFTGGHEYPLDSLSVMIRFFSELAKGSSGDNI